jgi:hypothetical protein
MHVLPLPFGMALALLPRGQARQLVRRRHIRREPPRSSVRDLDAAETRYAALRQVV